MFIYRLLYENPSRGKVTPSVLTLFFALIASGCYREDISNSPDTSMIENTPKNSVGDRAEMINESNGPRRLTDQTGQDRYPSFSSDGKKILFESNRNGKWKIMEMNSDGTDQKEIGAFDTNARFPSYLAESNHILFSKESSSGYRLATLLVENHSTLVREVSHEGEAMFPTVSPDGQVFAYSSNSDLFLQTHGEAKSARFASTEWREMWLRWSPDGKQAAFFSRRDTEDKDDEIYLMDYPNGIPKRITDRMGHDFCPSWSPDGTRLAVASVDEESGRSINIIDLDGRILSQIGLGFERVTEPSWSPDGKMITYAARKDGNYDVYSEVIQ